MWLVDGSPSKKGESAGLRRLGKRLALCNMPRVNWCPVGVKSTMSTMIWLFHKLIVVWLIKTWRQFGNFIYFFHFKPQQITITENHFINRFSFGLALELKFPQDQFPWTLLNLNSSRTDQTPTPLEVSLIVCWTIAPGACWSVEIKSNHDLLRNYLLSHYHRKVRSQQTSYQLLWGNVTPETLFLFPSEQPFRHSAEHATICIYKTQNLYKASVR
jgi:hypothetical protein